MADLDEQALVQTATYRLGDKLNEAGIAIERGPQPALLDALGTATLIEHPLAERLTVLLHDLHSINQRLTGMLHEDLGRGVELHDEET